MYEIVASVFSECTLSPQHKTDLAIAYSHSGNWDDVCQYEVNNVVTVKKEQIRVEPSLLTPFLYTLNTYITLFPIQILTTY